MRQCSLGVRFELGFQRHMTTHNQAPANDAVSGASRASSGSVSAHPPAPAGSDDRVIEFPGVSAPSQHPPVDVAPIVKVEQIRLLYQHPNLIVVNLINAALVVAVLWQDVPRQLLLGWFALFALVIPVRLVVAHAQARHRWPAARAARWAVVGSAVTGCLWGLLAFASSRRRTSPTRSSSCSCSAA